MGGAGLFVRRIRRRRLFCMCDIGRFASFLFSYGLGGSVFISAVVATSRSRLACFSLHWRRSMLCATSPYTIAPASFKWYERVWSRAMFSAASMIVRFRSSIISFSSVVFLFGW